MNLDTVHQVVLVTQEVEKTYQLKDTAWKQSFHNNMWELLQEDVLCDVTLLGADGISVKAHSVVLATCSKVLMTCLLQANPGYFKVKVQGFSGKLWPPLLSYMYTGQLSFGESEREDLISASSLLGLNDLQQLIESMDTAPSVINFESSDADISQDVFNCNLVIEESEEGSCFAHTDIFEQKETEEKETEELLMDTNPSNTGQEFIETQEPDVQDKKEGESKAKSSLYTCQRCGETIPWGKKLTVHEWRHKLQQPNNYPCSKCPKTFPTYHSMRAHERTHKYYPYKCTLCSAGFHFKVNYELHQKKIHGKEKDVFYRCELCQKIFNTSGLLQKHLSQMHKKKELSEDLSRDGKEIEDKKEIKEEILIPAQCILCNQEFPSRKLLSKHLKEEHQHKTVYPCPQCSRELLSQFALEEHLHTHSGERPYTCELCQESFRHKSTLKDHEKVKHWDQQTEQVVVHQCTVCSKVFRTKKLLRSHQLIHDGQEGDVWKCSECGATFDHRGSYVTHMMEHRGEKTWHCKYCDRGFPHKGNYMTHMQRHLGIKPFLCPHCGKSFVRKDDMKTHLRMHTGEKPYECKVCQMRCATVSNLREHERAKHHVTFGVKNPNVTAARNSRASRKKAQRSVQQISITADNMPPDIEQIICGAAAQESGMMEIANPNSIASEFHLVYQTDPVTLPGMQLVVEQQSDSLDNDNNHTIENNILVDATSLPDDFQVDSL